MKTPEGILALDIGTKMGWAHSTGISGTFELKIKRDESKGWRLIKLRARLNEFRDAVAVDVVVFEAVRNTNIKGRGALVVMAEYQAVIKMWCEENAIEYKGYSPSEIKEHATGSGRASKEAMVRAANQKWGKVLTVKENADEADALWILDYAMKDMGLERE